MASIRKRGGSYQITAYDGYNADGTQVKRTITWKPEPGMTARQIDKEVQRQAVLFQERIDKGEYMDGNIKFQDFTEKWFVDYAEKQVRPRTYYRYKEMAQRVYEAIGHIRVDKIRPHHIVEFIGHLSEPGQNKRTGGGLSPKTVKNYLSFVSTVLQTAVDWQMISDNPCRHVRPPRIEKTDIPCLSEEDAQRFMALLQKEPLEYRTMMTLLLLTGMRRGELLGLEWPDFDFKAKVLSINRTSQYVAAKGNYTDTTKTASSRRSLPISDSLLTLLLQYKAWQEERRAKAGEAWVPEWTEHPRLFTQWNGKPMFNNTPYRFLENFTKRHGLPHISVHSLRHTNATLLISEGADIKTVSALLGHSETSTTLNIYTHTVQKAKAAAAESLSAMLLNPQEGDSDAEKSEIFGE